MKVPLARTIDEAIVNPRDAGRSLAYEDCEAQADFILSFAFEVDRMNWAQQSRFIADFLTKNYSFDGCQQKVIYMLDTLLEHLK